MATNKVYDDGTIYLAVGAGITSGDPVLVGTIVGVALIDRDTDGYAVIDPANVYDLSVKGINAGGNVAVAVGDKIYYVAADTPKLNKKTSGKFFGKALEAIASGATDTIKVLVVNA
jgi:predicted RecA/RadA family phage recombinase